MYASQIPGLRGQGGAALYGQVNQTLTSADNRHGRDGGLDRLSAGAPRLRLLPVPEGPDAGLQDPAYAKAMLDVIHRTYGGLGKDAEDYYGGQATGMSANQYAAYRTSQTDAQGRPISTNPAATKRSSSGFGARKDITTGAIGLIGRLEGSQNQGQIDEVIQTPTSSLSGKNTPARATRAA